MWNIIRHGPHGVHYGKALQAFINNMQHHLVEIKVYKNGDMDVWGWADLDTFAGHLESGWVTTAPPVGSMISVFGLGMAEVDRAEWELSPESILKQVTQILSGFEAPPIKPRTDRRFKVKLGNHDAVATVMDSREEPYRIDAKGNLVRGGAMPILLPHDQGYRLTKCFVYADGMAHIGADGDLQEYKAIKNKLGSGELLTHVDAGKWIAIDGLGRFLAGDVGWGVDPDQRALEGWDIIDQLKGKQGAVDTCRAAHEKYQESPSPRNLKKLKTAYHRVPDHLKVFCGNMDSKDWPIKEILGPTE